MHAQLLSDGTVWLSRPVSADIDAISRACQHSSIKAWTTVPAPYLRTHAEHFVEVDVPEALASGERVWAIRRAENGPPVGMVGLHHTGRANRDTSLELGFWAAPAARGRGIMTRAVNMVCDYAFRPDGMRLSRVEWRAFTGNYPSAGVARRAGFQFEGTLRQAGLQRGQVRDSWVAGRLPTDPPGPAAGWPLETFA